MLPGLTLPASLAGLLGSLRPCFTGPSFQGSGEFPTYPVFTQYAVAGRYCAGCRHGHATSIM